MIIDSAATVGCSYILVQLKTDKVEDGYNFISMDSSNFKKGQLSLCPFEAEIAALRYACRKENHFLKCCPEVTVMTDCREMIGTHVKYDTAVDEIAERESLCPENGPAQRTRQRLTRGAGGLAVGAGGAC